LTGDVPGGAGKGRGNTHMDTLIGHD
jgi:hypothetical protein